MSAVAEILKRFSPEILPVLIQNLDEEEQGEFLSILEEDEQDEIAARCSEQIVAHDRGPMYWLRNLTLTENYHWQQQGRPTSKEPFPYKPHVPGEWDYLDWVMSFLLEGFGKVSEVYIPKTREMMTSWLVVGFCTWACQFFPNVQAIGQSEKDDKAQGLVLYANILYDNQPDWLRARHPLKRGDSGTAHKIEWANGSKFIAVPQGERQVASFHPTIYFNDESAHQPTFEATLNVVKPVAKQIICVSSAAHSRFGELCDQSLAV